MVLQGQIYKFNLSNVHLFQLDIEKNTLTGRIIFDGSKRKGYTLDVIELQSTGLVKIGVWEENKNFTFERPPQQRQIVALDDNSMVNKTYVVLISVPVRYYLWPCIKPLFTTLFFFNDNTNRIHPMQIW